MTNGIKITLFLLLVGFVIIGCNQDPKIEYIEVPLPCNDPSHGSTCDGNHAGIHDDCGPGCDHGDAVLPCNDATACIQGSSTRSASLNGVVWDRCSVKGCGDYTNHVKAVKDIFSENAMSTWEANGGPVHITDTSSSISPFVFQDPYTKRNINPCIGNEALTTAYNAAMARLNEIHPMD